MIFPVFIELLLLLIRYETRNPHHLSFPREQTAQIVILAPDALQVKGISIISPEPPPGLPPLGATLPAASMLREGVPPAKGAGTEGGQVFQFHD